MTWAEGQRGRGVSLAKENLQQEEGAHVLAELPLTSLELVTSPGAETQGWSQAWVSLAESGELFHVPTCHLQQYSRASA